MCELFRGHDNDTRGMMQIPTVLWRKSHKYPGRVNYLERLAHQVTSTQIRGVQKREGSDERGHLHTERRSLVTWG
jgi:hypothetical protein